MDKVKISAVSYLNSKPFVYGLQQATLSDQFDLSLDIPSQCASKLIHGHADIGLVPTAVYDEIPNACIVSDFCIASSGEVRTVVLFSQVPLHQIKRVILDNQSRTSVRLVRILAKHHWHINPEWVDATPGFESILYPADTAMVVIGDRVFEMESKFKFCFDLGLVWKQFSGFDFVFACWISNRELDIDFISSFNQWLAHGVNHLSEVIDLYAKEFPTYNLTEYYHNNIALVMDESKRRGMELFLKLNREYGLS